MYKRITELLTVESIDGRVDYRFNEDIVDGSIGRAQFKDMIC